MLVARNSGANNLVRSLPKFTHHSIKRNPISRSEVWNEPLDRQENRASVLPSSPPCDVPDCGPHQALPLPAPDEIDPLYLFACHVKWERSGDPSAAWEVISGTRSPNGNTRAHALSLLERSLHAHVHRPEESEAAFRQPTHFAKKAGMRAPYGFEIIESCMGCKAVHENSFCRFSPTVQRSMDSVSYHSVMPSGALLFVEGQTPRGMYILCSGKVKLSTTSKEGKVLILKQAETGEALGLSAAISGTNYEMTAET